MKLGDISLLAAPDSPQRILAFGKWGTYKRVDILLEAFEKIAQRCPRARLIVAGSNHPLTPGYIESLAARYCHRSNIEFSPNKCSCCSSLSAGRVQ